MVKNLYQVTFNHWRENKQVQIKLEADDQFDALLEFSYSFPQIEMKNCTINNFNLTRIG